MAPAASAGGYVPPRLAAPSTPQAPAAQPAPRLVRGVRGSEPAARAATSIPTPEELGVAPAGRPAPLDWAAARRQLAEVGAVRFGLEHLASGQVRFSCWLPAGPGEAPALVQADGASEAGVVRDCLEQARRRGAGKR